MAEVPAPFANHWIHSHEEDGDGMEVYRPSSYPFPPSRGRRGFRLSLDGRLTYYGVGPTDKPTVESGRWSSEGAGLIRLQFDDARRPPETLEVVSHDDRVLRIRRHRT